MTRQEGETRISRFGTKGSEDDAFPLEGVGAKIHEQSNAQLGRGEIVEDLFHMGVAQGVSAYHPQPRSVILSEAKNPRGRSRRHVQSRGSFASLRMTNQFTETPRLFRSLGGEIVDQIAQWVRENSCNSCLKPELGRLPARPRRRGGRTRAFRRPWPGRSSPIRWAGRAARGRRRGRRRCDKTAD